MKSTIGLSLFFLVLAVWLTMGAAEASADSRSSRTRERGISERVTSWFKTFFDEEESDSRLGNDSEEVDDEEDDGDNVGDDLDDGEDDENEDEDEDEGARPGPGINLIALHNSSSSQYNNQCVSCHGTMASETSLEPNIPAAHKVMMPFVPGVSDNDKCLHCHPTVDLVEQSAGALRRQVNPELCAACHSSRGPGLPFYAR
jgi:hypothetical protein